MSTRLEALLEISDTIAGASNLRDVLHMLAASLNQCVDFDYVAVLLHEPDSNYMRLHVVELLIDVEPPSVMLPLEESPAGTVFRTQQNLIIDVERETRFPRAMEILKQYNIKSCCYIPLTTSLRKLGAITFGSRQPDKFPKGDQPFLRRVANQVAIAIDNARNFEEAQSYQQKLAKERDRYRTLLEVNNAVASSLALPDFFDALSHSIRKVVKGDLTAVGLYDETIDKLKLYAFNFPGGKGLLYEGMTMPMNSPPGEAFKTGKSVIVRNIEPVQLPPEILEIVQAEGLKSACIVPLIFGNKTFGTLHVASRQEEAFSNEDAEFLTQLAGQIAISIANKLAYQQIDQLKNRLAEEKLYLEDEIRNEYFDEIVGESEVLAEVLEQVRTVAVTDSTVLVLGETGTGKELIARAIHNASPRRGKTFVKVNCSAIPTGLLESEVFGHEKGAFTGAIAQRIGRMELADKGTLFLDEIGDIPPELQPKLLRALQEREFERLGGSRTIRADVRLIAATHRNLSEMVQKREFRSDLYYRLNVFPIRLPPLRDRADDIPRLVRHFALKHAHKMNRQIDTIPADTMKALMQWHWPGNVRELENFIERAVILSRGSVLNVPIAELREVAAAAAASGNGNPVTLEDSEREHILKVLREVKGVLSGPAGAAARLGLKRTTLQGKMKKLGITRDSY